MEYETFGTIIGRCSARKSTPSIITVNLSALPPWDGRYVSPIPMAGGLALIWQVENAAASANFDVLNTRRQRSTTPILGTRYLNASPSAGLLRAPDDIDGYHDLQWQINTCIARCWHSARSRRGEAALEMNGNTAVGETLSAREVDCGNLGYDVPK